jgi:hypothetical protein
VVKAAVYLILALVWSDSFAQRAQADMRCTHTGTDFVYDCVVHIKKQVEPVPHLSITVGADMPSMPMAHNVKPVKARPGKAPGEYLFTLDLDMPGEWAVKLRLSGPVRDVVVVRYTFTETATPPRK